MHKFLERPVLTDSHNFFTCILMSLYSNICISSLIKFFRVCLVLIDSQSFVRKCTLDLYTCIILLWCLWNVSTRWPSSVGAQWWWRCGLCRLGEQTSKIGFSVLPNSEVGWLGLINFVTHWSVWHLGRLCITGKTENSVS